MKLNKEYSWITNIIMDRLYVPLKDELESDRLVKDMFFPDYQIQRLMPEVSMRKILVLFHP